MIKTIDFDKLTEDDIIEVLNEFQNRKYIRILDYDGFTLKLRDKIVNLIEPITTFNIQEYRDLFKGKKIGAMGSSITCISNMQEFIKKYPQYSWEHIIKATKAYINSCASDGYKYLMQADYFIKKAQDHTRTNNLSRLLQWCEEIEENDGISINTEIVQGI